MTIHNKHRTRLLAAAALAAPALLVGCGDDDASALTVEEYRRRGDQVCDEVRPQLMEALPDLTSPPTPAQVQQIAADLDGVLGVFVERFGALEPPAELEEGHDALLASLAEARGQLAAAQEDEAAAARMAETGPPLDDPAAAMASVGFSTCR